jgi:hypothetical protein
VNVLFLTQGTSLDMFHDLLALLREPLGVTRAGFFVADSRHYREFLGRHPDFESQGHALLKEWEVVARAREGEPDLARLRRWEEALGDPTLWGPLVADRRVFTGRLSSLRQDERPRFDRRTMLRILEEGLAGMERLFDELRPDAVVSFICVTFGDYMAHLVARQRGIPLLNLRPTRIRNYVTYGESVIEPSRRIQERYERYGAEGTEDTFTAEARAYIASVREGHAKYEGVLPPSRGAVRQPLRLTNWPRKAVQAARDEWRYRYGGLKKDHHVLDWKTATLYRRVLNPLRARQQHARLGSAYVQPGDLTPGSYVFFPLHTEPEVTLLVYSRPILNQIEVLRSVCLSVPVGMPVVVKEHPASVGKRPLAYYQRMLEIPGVVLADPALPSRPLIEGAALVATVAGSIGLESLLRGRPVLTFGATPYGYLPPTMTRRAAAWDGIADQAAALLRGHTHDEAALVHYVAATMRESVAVNLYTNLLGKVGVYAADARARADDLRALADYTVESITRARPPSATP